MTPDPLKGLSYEERQAWPVMRKLLKRKPEMAALLLDGTTKESATAVILKIRDELDLLLAMNRAFSEAAGAIVKATKEDV